MLVQLNHGLGAIRLDVLAGKGTAWEEQLLDIPKDPSCRLRSQLFQLDQHR